MNDSMNQSLEQALSNNRLSLNKNNSKKKKKKTLKIKKIDKIQSILFQARKNIIKGTKAVKGFLVQKVTRKINELKSTLNDSVYNDKKNGVNNSDNNSVSTELETEIHKLSVVKSIDFKQIGDLITDSKFGKNDSNNDSNNDSKNDIIMKYYDFIKNHKKINDIVNEYKTKYENEMKQKEEFVLKRKQQNENNQLKKSKKLNNRMNLGSLSQGVFLDNLNDDDNIDGAVKNENNNKQKLERKTKKPRKEMPLSPYMPSNRESINDTSELRQIRKPKNYEDDINTDSFPEKKRKYLNSNKKFSSSNHHESSSSSKDYNSNIGKMNHRNDSVNSDKRKERTIAVKDHDASDLKDLTVSGRNWKQSGVHPSWAAKQIKKTQQPAIVEAKGKKTVFED